MKWFVYYLCSHFEIISRLSGGCICDLGITQSIYTNVYITELCILPEWYLAFERFKLSLHLEDVADSRLSNSMQAKPK